MQFKTTLAKQLSALNAPQDYSLTYSFQALKTVENNILFFLTMPHRKKKKEEGGS